MKKRCCGNCKWFELWPKDEFTPLNVGECRDAIKRVREVVPFAVNLSASAVSVRGGKLCPCFELRKEKS